MTAPPEGHGDALLMTLQVAVPLRINELEQMRPDHRVAVMNGWRVDAAEAIGSRGDDLQFGARKRADVANVFNHMARGLAVLACAPGGVLFSGLHWCLEHPWGKQAASITELTCEGRTFPEVEPPPEPKPARPVETVVVSGVL